MKNIVAYMVSIVVLAGAGAALAADGKAIYDKKCKMCHNLTEKKKVGPGLKGVYGSKGQFNEKLDDETLKVWLKDSKAVNPKSKMIVKPALKDDEIAAVIEFLKTL